MFISNRDDTLVIGFILMTFSILSYYSMKNWLYFWVRIDSLVFGSSYTKFWINTKFRDSKWFKKKIQKDEIHYLTDIRHFDIKRFRKIQRNWKLLEDSSYWWTKLVKIWDIKRLKKIYDFSHSSETESEIRD